MNSFLNKRNKEEEIPYYTSKSKYIARDEMREYELPKDSPEYMNALIGKKIKKDSAAHDNEMKRQLGELYRNYVRRKKEEEHILSVQIAAYDKFVDNIKRAEEFIDELEKIGGGCNEKTKKKTNEDTKQRRSDIVYSREFLKGEEKG